MSYTWSQILSARRGFSSFYNEWQAARTAGIMAAINSTCPATSMHSGYCYDGFVTDPTMAIPGGFSFASVGFNITELKTNNGTFVRTYTPNSDQRWDAENMILTRSREYIDQQINFKRIVLLSDSTSVFRTDLVDPSVNAVQRWVPDLRWTVNNFTFNSIAPTAAEMNNKGGYSAWIARGGFPISWDVVNGKVPIYSGGIAPQVCTSILCSCNGKPACIRGEIGKDGVIPPGGSSSGDWLPYIKVDQAAPFNFTVTLKFRDDAWYKKAAGAIAGVLEKLGNLLCASAPQVQQQIQAATAEICVNSSKQPCTKGSIGCKCTTPSAATQSSAGLLNFTMNQLCTAWNKEQSKTLTPWNDVPPMPDQQITGFTIPLPWVAVGGLILGAILFTRR